MHHKSPRLRLENIPEPCPFPPAPLQPGEGVMVPHHPWLLSLLPPWEFLPNTAAKLIFLYFRSDNVSPLFKPSSAFLFL